MKNLTANGGEKSGRGHGPGLLVVAALFGSIFIVGCTTNQPKGGQELSDFDYRILYPRDYYNYSADRSTQLWMDKENAVLSKPSK